MSSQSLLEAQDILNISSRQTSVPQWPMRWEVTKTYGSERGFSVAFRQWRASSHCRHLHGYSLGISITFTGNELDKRYWLIDFGGFKILKAQLEEWFDHTTLIAADDPALEDFDVLDEEDICKVKVLPNVGIEAFSEFIGMMVLRWIGKQQVSLDNVYLKSVTVSEHGANSATWNNIDLDEASSVMA